MFRNNRTQQNLKICSGEFGGVSMRHQNIVAAEQDDLLREKMAGVLLHFKDTLMATRTGRDEELLRAEEGTDTDTFLLDAAIAAHVRNAFLDMLRMRSDIKTFPKSNEQSPRRKHIVESVGAPSVIQNDRIIGALPLEDNEAREKEPCVLLADDEEFFRRRMEKALNMAFIRHNSVFSGEQAYIEIVSSPGSYSCLVMDVHLKNVGGFAAGRMIRDVVRELPIIYVTTDESAKTLTEAESIGCSAFIKKPFIKDAFLAAVRKAIAEKSQYAKY
jgi:CheY-like chemotaxis protein